MRRRIVLVHHETSRLAGRRFHRRTIGHSMTRISSPVDTVPAVTTTALQTASALLLALVHPPSSVDTESLAELGAPVVRLRGDFDDGGADLELRADRQIGDRQVEVDEELVTGQRPTRSVAGRNHVDDPAAHHVQLRLGVGRTVIGVRVAALDVVVAGKTTTHDQFPDIEFFAGVDIGSPHDHLDRADAGRARTRSGDAGVDLPGREIHARRHLALLIVRRGVSQIRSSSVRRVRRLR